LPGFHAIVLAAGQSSRMGREKASLPWLDGKSLLAWTIETLESAGWDSLAVVGPSQLETWNRLLPGRIVLNPSPELGKHTSLVKGVEQIPSNASHILVTAVDQPRLPLVYLRLREEAQNHSERILVPDREGHRGHPVVLNGSLRSALLGVSECTLGLRGLLDAHATETCRLRLCDPAWLRWDVNTLADYDEAFHFFQMHA
jgi:molybdenum cofactor cytidylyltransferase